MLSQKDLGKWLTSNSQYPKRRALCVCQVADKEDYLKYPCELNHRDMPEECGQSSLAVESNGRAGVQERIVEDRPGYAKAEGP